MRRCNDIEKRARFNLEHLPAGHADVPLNRAVLAMVPVVRAAMEWQDSDCTPGCPGDPGGPHWYDCSERRTIMALCGKLDALRAAMEEK